MKQYIKKALWIIPFVFSLNLSAATWYFVGAHSTSPEQASRASNWYSNSSGTGGVNPSGNAATYFNQGDNFDFNGYNTKSIDMRACTIGNSTFTNSGSSVTVTNTGTMTLTGSVVFGTTNTTYNFSSSSSTVTYSGTATSQDILPFTYFNLTIQGTTVSNIASSTKVTVNGTLTFNKTSHILTVAGTLELAANSSYTCTTGVVMEITSTGSITDNRASASQNFCGVVKHFTSNDVNSGIYDELQILSSCKLKSNIQCNNVIIGGDVYQYILNLNSKSLTVLQQLVVKSYPANDEYSRINPNLGTIIFNSNTQYTYDPEHFGNDVFYDPYSLVNPYNIITKGAGGILFTSTNPTIEGDLTIDNSFVELYNSTPEILGILKITGSNTNWVKTKTGSSTNKIKLNTNTSSLLINSSSSTLTHPVDIFTSNEINKLELNFQTGGTFSIANNITIKSELIISASSNYLSLNDKNLTLYGTITNVNGSSGGKLIGSASSSLTCGATGHLYFNQTGTDSVLRNLTINNSKTVNLGNSLKIVGGSSFGVVTVESGSTLNTNGNLTLRSHAGGSAMIGNSPGTISGTIMVETFIPATARRFRFLSSPVTGATAVHWRNNGTYTKYIGTQITGGGANWSTHGFDESLTNNPSAFYYNEAAAGDDTTVSPGASNDAGWTAFSSGSEALVNGKGFRVLVRGDRGIDLKGTGGSTSPIATTLKVTGSYVGTSATINVTNSGRTKLNNGINFVGNPYPCTIDWDALTLTNVDPSYLIYDPSGNRYRAWNGTTGGAGRYISSGQAFSVYCTSTSGGSITVNESDKVTNTTGGSFFQTKLTNHLKIELAYDTLNLDETYIHFREDATDRLDRFDVRQVKNSGVNIASIDSANLAYNINSLGNLTGSRRIPLSVEGTAISNGFKMTFNDVATFPFHKIYLVDNFKGTKTLLQEAASFIVDITADKASYQNGRFYLDFEELPQTNIKKINNDMGLVLFPNPANDIINLEFGNTLKNKNFQYNISTIHGESVLTGNIIAAEQNKINIKNLASGIYFINISNSEKSQSIQFIKK